MKSDNELITEALLIATVTIFITVSIIFTAVFSS